MPQILTKYFGSTEYVEQQVVRFPGGIPAFEEETEFVVLEPADRAPLVFLQSTRQPGLCFLTLPILVIDPHYQLELTVEDLEFLELETSRQPVMGEDMDCLAVLLAPENGRPSANLLAPIVINRRNQLGTQAIRLDSLYSHQHWLIGPEDACS